MSRITRRRFVQLAAAGLERRGRNQFQFRRRRHKIVRQSRWRKRQDPRCRLRAQWSRRRPRRGIRQDERRRDRLSGRSRQHAIHLEAEDDRARLRQSPEMRLRPPQDPGRQESRRYLHRHAKPLAYAADHLGLPGGQARLRGEAVQPHDFRGPQVHRGRGQVRRGSAARHAAAERQESGPPRLPHCTRESGANSR